MLCIVIKQNDSKFETPLRGSTASFEQGVRSKTFLIRISPYFCLGKVSQTEDFVIDCSGQ